MSKIIRKNHIQKKVWILALFFTAFFIFQWTSEPAYGSEQEIVIVVQPGDTLWSIASEHANHQDVRKVMDRIIKNNHLNSTFLQVGDEIIVR